MPGIPRGVNGWILVNYDLDYIGCLRDYYRYTGDRDALTRLWPAVQKLIPSDEAVPRQVGTAGQLHHQRPLQGDLVGIHGVLEMQYLIAMQDASYLAQVMGDEAIRSRCEEILRAARVFTTPISAKSWGLSHEPGNKTSTSWHVNAFSSLAGVGDYKQVAEKLGSSSRRPATAGFMLYWTLETNSRPGWPRRP